MEAVWLWCFYLLTAWTTAVHLETSEVEANQNKLLYLDGSKKDINDTGVHKLDCSETGMAPCNVTAFDEEAVARNVTALDKVAAALEAVVAAHANKLAHALKPEAAAHNETMLDDDDEVVARNMTALEDEEAAAALNVTALDKVAAALEAVVTHVREEAAPHALKAAAHNETELDSGVDVDSARDEMVDVDALKPGPALKIFHGLKRIRRLLKHIHDILKDGSLKRSRAALKHVRAALKHVRAALRHIRGALKRAHLDHGLGALQHNHNETALDAAHQSTWSSIKRAIKMSQ